MRDDDNTVPASASEVAAALKEGDIDALVELAKTLQEKTGDMRSIGARGEMRLTVTARDGIRCDAAYGRHC